jgi:hypothetical protein
VAAVVVPSVTTIQRPGICLAGPCLGAGKEARPAAASALAGASADRPNTLMPRATATAMRGERRRGDGTGNVGDIEAPRGRD